MAIRILIVEDEPLADDFRDYLMMLGHHCDVCRNVDDAIDCLINAPQRYHILILDLKLPEEKAKEPTINAGLKILQHIAAEKLKIGKIIVSANGQKMDTLIEGANIYLSKEVDLAELQLSVKNLFRDIFGGELEKCGDLCFDFPGKACTVGTNQIIFTRKEFELLEFLYQNRERVVTHSAIFAYLCPEREDNGDYELVFRHISTIRKKIREQGGKEHIVTIAGIGYKFICECDEAK